MTAFRSKSRVLVSYTGREHDYRWGENRVGIMLNVPRWVARIAVGYIWWRRDPTSVRGPGRR